MVHTYHLIITDTDMSTCVRNEADYLLLKLRNSYSCILSYELTTEVELIVCTTWEANDIWRSGCQITIARI